MTPKVTDAYLQARRDQIIEAACTSFVEKGLDKTTMPEIIRAAGLSSGAVYNYFSSKEDIIEACASKSLERNAGLMAAAESDQNIDPLVSMVRKFLPMLKEPGMVKAAGFDLDLYSESTRNPKIARILKANSDALLEQLNELVKQMQAEGRFNKKLDSMAISRFLIGMVYGLIVSKIVDPETDIDAAIEVCEAAITGTFCSSKAANKSKEIKKNEKYPSAFPCPSNGQCMQGICQGRFSE